MQTFNIGKYLLNLLFGVLVPIFYFYMSGYVAPDWQDPELSRFSTLIYTKYFLTPLAVWAWTSFYLTEVLKVRNVKSWMTLGLFTGAVGSYVCAALLFLLPANPNSKVTNWAVLLIYFPLLYFPIWFYLIKVSKRRITSSYSRALATPSIIYLLFLFVRLCFSHSRSTFSSVWILPLIYIPLWYFFAAYKAAQAAPVAPKGYASALFIQSLFWIFAAKKAVEEFGKLPVDQPDCYIVTASTYGYSWLVKKQICLDLNQKVVLETEQLRRCRRFEQYWQHRSPQSHKWFRIIYNRLGPILAKKIRTPFIASISYIAIKPIEWVFVTILYFGGEKGKLVQR